MDYVGTLPENSVMIGDFNFPKIEWNTLECSSPTDKLFLNTTQDKFLTQLVDFPTNFTPQKNGTITATCIDLLLTNSPSLVASVIPVGQLGASHHTMVLAELIVPTCKNDTTELIPDYSKADFNEIRLKLANTDWTQEFVDKNAVESWDVFKEKLVNIVEESVPKRIRRSNNRPLWMQQNIMRIIRKKKRLWAWYCTTQDYKDKKAHDKVNAEISRIVKRAKRTLERKLAKDAKKNPKPFYRYMSSMSSSKSKVGPLHDEAGRLLTDESDMVTNLNNTFTSVFTAEDKGNMPNPTKEYAGETPLTNTNITPETVKKKIDLLDPHKSPGPDMIHPTLVKELAEQIAVPLSVIFNKSLQEGVVPPDWKLANVSPIFKKGNRTSASNYRPISLTSIICRLMESILRDAIVEHLKSNNLIRGSQHGFMPHRSCLTNLLEFLEVVTRLIDEGHSVDLLYLDFARAFDKVPHARLMMKVRAHGITGKIADWIEQWLSDRKQRVVLNGTASALADVTSGVPQGSVLGPTLFIIFINDIDTAVDLILTLLKKFADDTKLGFVVNRYEQCMQVQKQLDNIYQWSQDWQMLFNLDKCVVMHLGTTNTNHTYHLNGHELKSTVCEKDLGVHIHSSLKPSVHIAEIVKKANQILGLLLKSVTYRDKIYFVKLYKQRVRCHLELAVQAWSPWTQHDIDLIESVQKRAIRNVSGLNGSYEEKLKQIGLTTLSQRRCRGDMLQTYKILNNVDDVSPATWFKPMHTRQTNATRSSTHISSTGAEDTLNLVKPKARLELRRNFFSHRVVDKWNSLPFNLQTASSVNAFKSSYDRYHI